MNLKIYDSKASCNGGIFQTVDCLTKIKISAGVFTSFVLSMFFILSCDTSIVNLDIVLESTYVFIKKLICIFALRSSDDMNDQNNVSKKNSTLTHLTNKQVKMGSLQNGWTNFLIKMTIGIYCGIHSLDCGSRMTAFTEY